MPGTADTIAVALRAHAGSTDAVDRPPAPSTAPDSPTPNPANDTPVYCPHLLKEWQWQAIDPVRPLPRPTLLQRLFNWLYEYNRY